MVHYLNYFCTFTIQTNLMAKNYFYTITLLVFLFSVSLSAQETKQQPRTQETATIEGLSLYPNPVTNGKVYITTKNDFDKEIIISDGIYEIYTDVDHVNSLISQLENARDVLEKRLKYVK